MQQCLWRRIASPQLQGILPQAIRREVKGVVGRCPVSNNESFLRKISSNLPSIDHQTDQTFTLSNNHTIGYSICGPKSSPPIFFLHGYPSSRFEGALLSKIANKVGARIISPDRPGIGLSTFDPHRKLLDYPKDISQLASHLGLKAYSVVGGSGGGPYALACAKVLPKSELKGVGVLAGVGPVDLGLDGMRLSTRIFMSLMRWTPGLLKWVTDMTVVRAIRNPDPNAYKNMMTKQWRYLTKAERELFFKDPETIDDLVRVTREHFRQGSEASMKEGQIAVVPWGFKLEDVDCNKVKLWYAAEDINTPVQMGRKMAARLKNAELKEYPGETHFTLSEKYGEEILRDIVSW